MKHRRPDLKLPVDVIDIITYEEFHQYMVKFAEGELGLVLLLGRPGTGKTETVKRVVGFDEEETHRQGQGGAGRRVLYVEGHAQPFGLYGQLWEHRDCPVILDDLDRLYGKPECVRLLKPLCSNRHAKRITWYTNATLGSGGLPSSFITTSNVILIANEWRSLNANVQALEDRAIIIHFAPTNVEVHRQVATWFDDQEVFDFVGRYLGCVPHISMRHYEKGSMLRGAKIADWKNRLLQMILPDKRMAVVAALQVDPELGSDKERVDRFVQETGQSRPTYYRLKQDLPNPDPPVLHLTLPRTPTVRLLAEAGPRTSVASASPAL